MSDRIALQDQTDPDQVIAQLEALEWAEGAEYSVTIQRERQD